MVALIPTIYKLRITLSDIDRVYYDSLNLTIAQHPFETLERMMTRAFENQQLTQRRDWLLPMLMNGQVTVA